MFSPVDFHSELSRFRRHMNHLFREFDRSFPLGTDPFVNANQQLLQDLDRPMQVDLTSGNSATEQKVSAEQKQPNPSNQMAVEPPSTQAAGSAAASSAAAHPANALSAPNAQPQQPSNSLHPWGWGVGSLVPAFNGVSIPRVDVVENSDNFLVNCDLPGMAKDDVKVSVSGDGLLSISAERSEQHEQKDDKTKYHRIERSYGKFKRSLQLPNNVDAEAVKAKHENGLLQITVPKKPKQESKQQKHIPIH